MSERETMTMVERVIAAIRSEIRVDATGLAPTIASAYIVGIEEAARAAIEAMREPTYEMRFGQGSAWPEDAAKTWRAMIDAALAENSNG